MPWAESSADFSVSSPDLIACEVAVASGVAAIFFMARESLYEYLAKIHNDASKASTTTGISIGKVNRRGVGWRSSQNRSDMESFHIRRLQK